MPIANIQSIANSSGSVVVHVTGDIVGTLTFQQNSSGVGTGTFTYTSSTSGVQSIVAGTNITVDSTDPANPIVSAA
jgi:hypothetical protein